MTAWPPAVVPKRGWPDGGRGRTRIPLESAIDFGRAPEIFGSKYRCIASAVQRSTMLYMAKKPLPLRIDEELLRRVDEARGDVPRTRFVERALEKALDAGERSEVERMPPVARPGAAPPRAPGRDEERIPHSPPKRDAAGSTPAPATFDPRAAASERQRKLNERKGL